MERARKRIKLIQKEILDIPDDVMSEKVYQYLTIKEVLGMRLVSPRFRDYSKVVRLAWGF